MDAYIDKHSTKSQKIYWLVLIVIVAAIVSLPFIYVDISVQDVGVIRPIAEKTEIKASLTEFIDSVYVKEGWKVHQGDTLLTFRTSNPNYKINYQQNRIDDFREHLNDLRYLSKGTTPSVFSSDTRRQEYLYYCKQSVEAETTLGKTKKDYQRNKPLFDKGVISEEEFEKYEYEYSKAENELASLKDNQISKWQTDLNTYSNSYNEMQAALKQEVKEKDSYVVISPVSGTLDQFRGLYKGSSIQTGTSLAVISPDSTLFCEVYVTPRNIGYLHLDMPVNIQVESFNYNEWGIISGKVVEISSDFFTDSGNNNAFYKVKCSIDRNYLVRKNGVKGNLKKGMTISTHFMITRRSLFELLYQKMDDWANPTQYTTNTLAKQNL
ncbi:HlyD family secretion protein [Parabacteroides sp. Marseille-P3160]|uniref:HlyD family secretion protein n=1 Tax=Parabacteroides sp. Marseille-P3160 TaxID=1917887 RepID=UPI001F30C15A|nr:HlyD family efflux transporter periplasmic adaptor subunit [Parabacteroides sp. Marseille-P3160]